MNDEQTQEKLDEIQLYVDEDAKMLEEHCHEIVEFLLQLDRDRDKMILDIRSKLKEHSDLAWQAFEKSQKQSAIMREALEFYANRATWTTQTSNGARKHLPDSTLDTGDKAREALAKVNGVDVE